MSPSPISRRTALKGTAAAVLGAGGVAAVGTLPAAAADGSTEALVDDTAADTIEAAEPVLVRGVTPDGVEYGLYGIPKNHPVPIMLVLTATIDQALTSTYYRQGTRYFVGAPTHARLVSIDLPAHGTQRRPGENENGLVAWAERAVNREDFTAEFLVRMRSVVDHLIATGVADPAKIIASGTSRGGFCALRYAGHDTRVLAALGYAPVTDLRALGVFRIAAHIPEVDDWSLDAHAAELTGRPTYVVIGDRDTVVSTDACIRYVRKVSNADTSVPSNIELHLFSEPRGHTMPPDGSELSGLWIAKVLQQLPKMFVADNQRVFRTIVDV